MKTIIVVSALFLSVVVFSSCQKEITGDIGSTDSSSVGSLVKKYSQQITSGVNLYADSFNLTYDSQNRVTTIISQSIPGNKFVYQYNSNNTYTMDLYESNLVSVHEIFFINGIGLVDSTIQHDDTGDSTAEKYLYNADKLLVQLKEYQLKGAALPLVNTTTYQYDGNRNIIKEKTNTSETNIEYYSDLLNTLNVGMVYFSKTRNLPKTTTINGGTILTSNHTYTFDTLNRLTSEKITYSTGEVIVNRYGY